MRILGPIQRLTSSRRTAARGWRSATIPGPCPGDGWHNFAQRGKPGKPGARGERGERGLQGAAAPSITAWIVEAEHYRAVPMLSDGSRAQPLELRDLFEQFQIETRGHHA